MKSLTSRRINVRPVLHQLTQLGARTLAGMATAVIAVVLMLISTEVGIAVAVVAVIFGGISALLIHPHAGV